VRERVRKKENSNAEGINPNIKYYKIPSKSQLPNLKKAPSK